MPRIIGNPTVTPMAIPDWNQNDSSKADYIKNKPDIFTKKETNDLLDKKANKSDISNVYKFKGSVDTFDEYMTSATYEIIPKGEPTYNGVVVGTYDAENRTITIDSDKLSGWEDYDVVVPIKEITVPKGYYECDEYISVAGMDGYWFGQHSMAYKKTDEEVVTEVHIGTYGYLESGTYQLGTLNKLSSVQVKLAEFPFYSAEYKVVDTLEVGDVYNVLDTDVNYAWTGTEWDALGGTVSGGVDIIHRQDKNNPHSVTASQVGAYTKQEVDSKLSNKVNKSDITNVYKFMGSVNTFDDLPIAYPLIPNGVPTHNGVACGTYDEETHTVTINDVFLEQVHDGRIVVPIVPISIKAGKYYTDSVYYGNAYIGNLDTYMCGAGGNSYVNMPEQTIDRVEIFTPYGEETISGTTNSLGTLDKIVDSWLIYEWSNYPEIPNGAYDNGAVYNVLEDGMNYAWTGTDWDALGGSVADESVKEDINKMKTELDKKANKEDVVSAYRFCGSVDKFEDLPVRYALIPNGVPTFNGEPCGTYDEETHTVTIRDIKINDGNDKLIIPIVPISIKAGKYYCDDGSIFNDFFMEIGVDAKGYPFTTYSSYSNDDCCEMPSQAIEYIEVEDVYQDVGAVNGNTNYLGALLKVIDSWCAEDEGDRVYIPENAYDAGAIYEVKKSGIDDDGNDIATSYGWTGSSWDALGTSHIDQEARDGIENLEIQMGDVETALNSIIEIQNSLIGGDKV